MADEGAERNIAEFLAKYTLELARAGAECRAKLRKRVARGFELVYDNCNALVLGIGDAAGESLRQCSECSSANRWNGA